MLVKICGITRMEDAMAAADAGADAVGFNFWRPGKRYIEPELAAEIAAALPARMGRVGVFVDEAPEVVVDYARMIGLDVLQFHGEETIDYIGAIPFRAWKVMRMTPDWSLSALLAYPGIEAVVLDTPGATPGGTGRPFDWRRAAVVKKWRRVILAGGLTPDNVGDAVRIVQPWGVDVASGVESAPGIKNHKLIQEFVKAARQSERVERVEEKV